MMAGSYGAQYARLYREHWWWRARETVLLDILRALRPQPGSAILDVGCGDAVSFQTLSEFGTVRGIEVDENLLDPSGPFRERISTRPLGDPIYDAPSWRFDLITALDVIEHIDDDRGAISSMAAMLRPGGLLVVTVPAFETLWDQHDEINNHRRRYTARRLRRTLDGDGLGLLQVRYLFRALFIPKLLVRLVNAGRSRKVAQHGIPGPAINAALQRVCVIEDRLLRRLPVPFGTSVIGVARKRASV
jgi:2-polyprenyl-3-methyl-5-hydroxy-6-metoxy-1,4-benzoquinol methylase